MIDRLRHATQADRDLDGELFELFGGEAWRAAIVRASMPSGAPREICERDARHLAPRYTASIDDAIELLPDNWSWRVGNLPSGRAFASLGTQTSLQDVKGATPALALCIACAIARLASREIPL